MKFLNLYIIVILSNFHWKFGSSVDMANLLKTCFSHATFTCMIFPTRGNENFTISLVNVILLVFENISVFFLSSKIQNQKSGSRGKNAPLGNLLLF